MFHLEPTPISLKVINLVLFNLTVFAHCHQLKVKSKNFKIQYFYIKSTLSTLYQYYGARFKFRKIFNGFQKPEDFQNLSADWGTTPEIWEG